MLPWFKKIYLFLSFFFIGLVYMPIIDLAVKLQVLILTILHLVPFIKVPCNSQIPIAEWGQKRLEWLYEFIFDLNSVELQNFEKQRNYIQVTFEDFIMVSLQILIQFRILNVPKVTMYGESKQASIRSAVSTAISIISTLFQLFVESKGYQEVPCEYIILSLKAKPDWIPFGNGIKSNKINFDVDFTMIELQLPYLTTILGWYQIQEFQFSESNLKQLAAILDVFLTKNQFIIESIKKKQIREQRDLMSQDPELNLIREHSNKEQDLQNEGKQFIPHIRFGFSMLTITAHTFLSFINKTQQRNKIYVFEFLDFNGIDWEQLVINSKLQKLDLKNGKIDGGKPLLQVCIENEDSLNNRWQLKPLMELLLKAKDGCNPNTIDENKEYTMLSYCYQNRYHLAFDLLVKTQSEVPLDLNQKNPIDGSTIYGMVFKSGVLLKIRQEAYHQSYLPFEKLNLLFQINDGQHGINIHKNQVQSSDGLVTPILFYQTRIDKNKFNTLEEMKNDEIFGQLFGVTEFKLNNEMEIQQILSYIIEKKSGICECLVKEAYDSYGGSLNHVFEKQDEQGNNFMHLTGCRVSDLKWPKYLNNGLDALKRIAKKQLKQKNNNQQTPIQTMLQDDSQFAIKVKGLQKLFNLDLIDKSTFVGIEQDIINGFFQRAIKHHQSDSFNTFIDKTKFFDAFNDTCKAYKTMRDRFTISDQLEIFNQYFQDDRIEHLIDNTHQNYGDIENQYSKVNQQSFQKIMGSQVYKKPKDVQLLKDYSQSNKNVLGNSRKQLNELKKQYKERRYFICETILNGLIEMASSLDFFSDIYIVYQLSQTQHTGWFSFALFTLLAPYLTVQQSAISYKVVQMRLDIEKNNFKCSGYLITLLLILPTFIILLIILDMVYMIISFFVYIVLFIGLCTKSRSRIYDKYSEIMNNFFQNYFQMTAMDLQDFKNQRTILQLHLESVPQILFQIYVLFQLRKESNGDGDNNITSNDNTRDQFNVQSIVISLICAALHVILELVDINLKAKTSDTSFKNYMAASYSARLGWLPQGKDLYEKQYYQQQKKSELESRSYNYEIRYNSNRQPTEDWTESDTDDEFAQQIQQPIEGNSNQNSQSIKSKKIQFDNKNYKFKYFGYSVTFEFSDNTIHYLFSIISNMQQVDQKFKDSIKTIKLSECIQNLSLNNVIQLIRLAHKKIRLEFDEDVLDKLMQKDSDFIEYIQDPENHKEDSPFHKYEYLLIEMIVLDNAQFLRLMLQNGAKLDIYSLQTIESNDEKQDNIEKNSNVFKIAYKMKSRKSLALLLEKKDLLNIDEVYNTIKENEILYKETVGTIKHIENVHRPLHPLLLLDPNMIVPYDLMTSFDHNLKKVIQKNPESIEVRWHILYGAYVPKINFQGETKLVSLIENIVQWIQYYPEEIGIIQKGKTDQLDQLLLLDRQFLTQFSLIRRLFHTKSNLSQQRKNFMKNLDIDTDLKQIECDISDILVLYEIYHNQKSMSTIDQLARCDKIIKSFGFDKNWSQYYHYSRDISSILNEYEYIETLEVQGYELDKTLSHDTLAIKELIILSTNDPYDKIDSEERAQSLKFTFEMAHYTGNIENISIPPTFSFNLAADLLHYKYQVLAALSFNSLKSQQDIYDHKFIRFHKTLLNSITSGHKITVQVLNDSINPQPVECIFILKLVKDLQSLRNVEVQFQCQKNHQELDNSAEEDQEVQVLESIQMEAADGAQEYDNEYYAEESGQREQDGESELESEQ